MKRPGLTAPFASATLFLFAAFTVELSAQDMKAEMREGKAARKAGELMQRYDKNGDGRLDDDERADAKEQMLRDQVDRQMARAAALPGGLEQFRAEVLQMFDRNRNGQLEDEERAAAQTFATRQEAARVDREELEKHFDKNRDGTMDGDERAKMDSFLSALRGLGSVQTRFELIRRFDANSDGRIDERELVELEKVVRPRVEASPEQLRRHDTNRDGIMDDPEWAVARVTIAKWLNGSGDAVNQPVPPGDSAYKPSAEAEQRRLKAVANEVARRRAIREAATKNSEAAPKQPAR